MTPDETPTYTELLAERFAAQVEAVETVADLGWAS